MIWLLGMVVAVCAPPEDLHRLEIRSVRAYQVGDLPIDLTVEALDEKGKPVAAYCGPAEVSGLVAAKGKKRTPLTETPPFAKGKVVLENVVVEGDEVVIRAGDVEATWKPDLRQLPGVLAILPPVFAILLAVLLRQALLSLFAGVWLGALFINGYNPISALARCFDTYLPSTLIDKGHASIILFTMALGGMVGIVSRCGATAALVDAISRRAHSRRSGMLTGWASGLVVFFDDYANCLLVGNTVRPFTDRMKISREKLSYIVDCTAAPVATIALVSTWIGYQVGLLEDVFGEGAGYDLFLNMLPYSFYSFFTIAFVFVISVTLRDFGPMRRAELRALRDGQVLRPGARPLMDRELTDSMGTAEGSHWMSAVVPVLSVIVIVAVGLIISGRDALGDDAAGAGLRDIVSAADSYAVLTWAAFGGSLIAMGMVLGRRELGFNETIDAWLGGVKAMVMATLILVLAWSLGSVCKEYLQTGPWVLSQVKPSPHWLPVITFGISGLIALATGSSYSTMAIVIPIAGPMAWELTGDTSGLDPDTTYAIRHATLAAVLGGSVFGDHCSPISDTTIMSSMSAASDHMDHVRTQAPYAFLVALAAALIGFLPAGWGISPLFTVPLGIAALTGFVFLVGRRVDAATD